MEVFDPNFIENTREQFNAVNKETINRISYIVGKYGLEFLIENEEGLKELVEEE